MIEPLIKNNMIYKYILLKCVCVRVCTHHSSLGSSIFQFKQITEGRLHVFSVSIILIFCEIVSCIKQILKISIFSNISSRLILIILVNPHEP